MGTAHEKLLFILYSHTKPEPLSDAKQLDSTQ